MMTLCETATFVSIDETQHTIAVCITYMDSLNV